MFVLRGTGRKLTAEDARAAGLVARIVDAAELDATLKTIAVTVGDTTGMATTRNVRALSRRCPPPCRR